MTYKIKPIRPCKFFFSSRISLASSLKKTKAKLVLLTDIDMLLMVEKWIRGGICYSSNRHRKINDILNVLNVTKVACQQFQFGESFIKSYNRESDERYFLDVPIQYPENLRKTQNDLPFFFWKNETWESVKACC